MSIIIRISCLLCLALIPFSGFAQGKISKADLDSLKQYEADMVIITDSLYQSPLPDLQIVYCEKLTRMLVKALHTEHSYQYPFEKLGEKINIIYPEDNSFRIFNWSILSTEVTLRYYGAIQLNSPELKLFPLSDYSDRLTGEHEDQVLAGGKWFGSIIYRIMSHKTDGVTVYTLFGLNKGGMISNKKILDPMVLTPDGPVFGRPMFQVRNQRGTFDMKNRFIMEYKKEAQASLNWDESMKLIYYDRLASQVNDPNRKYTFVPSGSYDGLRWNNGRWLIVEDLIPALELQDGQAPVSAPPKRKQRR